MAETHISIALGITIGLLASFVQSLGLTIQRKSHVLNGQLPEHEQRLEHRRPLWLLGFAIFISSNILGSLVQIASLPVVILAPLGAVSLLWNAFFSRILLGDVFSVWMVVGTLLIAGGAVLIAEFGMVPEPTRSLQNLLDLFRRPTFVIYFSLLGVVVAISLAITHLTEYRLYKLFSHVTEPSTPRTPPTHLSNPSNLTTGVTQTVEDVISSERTPLLPKSTEVASRAPSFASTRSLKDGAYSPNFHRTRLLLAISYASFSGILSGMCLLFAKSGVELLLLTIQGDNQFWRWESWVLVLGLVVFALLQLWYLHKALILADPTLVCPSAFCFYNLSSIVNGLVYFDQFSLIAPLYLCLVALGIVILLAGVWVVSIHAGGGAVDLSWNNSTELVSDIEDSTSPIDIEVGESSHWTPTHQDPNGEDGGSTEEWGTMSEPLLNSNASTPDILATPRTISHTSPTFGPGSNSKHTRSRTNTMHRRRPTLEPSYTQSSTYRHNRISYFNSSNTRGPSLSPPLPSVSALAGAGFQIGLSPVSPGFVIVPKERRRRSSNLSTGVGSTLNGDDSVLSPGIGIGHPRQRRSCDDTDARRRTVSEGDMIRRAAVAPSMQNRTEDLSVPQSLDTNNDERPASGSAEGRGARAWKWFGKTGKR
ncbi:hypothetical protein E1B28_001084 [Marasmius oreades]|uniref:Uncharacterized protein n=1 Tax=Marasmius oreades TaxID=181124 RepID=A0A9P7V2W5_9AGAR|nr:uncharacterized protein E1B28_001084 [Marasmius oreades]KAG7099217.1 hypothetical protein E1B28_001084 [Marasmius oreades]